MKTRKLRKSMMSAVVILMAAVLSLTGATYAWFTTGTQAFVGDITAGVEEGSGLLISTDGINWSSNINIDKPDGFKYLAVSSAGETDANGQLKLFSAVLDTSGSVHKIGNIQAATGGYLTFDIYFNNANGSDKDIKFTSATIIGNKLADNEISSARAFRIAFINQGYVDATTAGEGFSSILTTKKEGIVSTIYEPYSTRHITNGILDYKTYNPGASSSSEFEYYGIKAIPETAIERYVGKYVNNGTTDAPNWEYQEDTSDYLKLVETKTDVDLADDPTLFTIAEKSYTKITVVIWLEGQDADCLNEVSGGEFQFNVGFEVVS